MIGPWQEGDRRDPQQRYLTDPMFKMLVDQLEAAIHRADYTPTELREAALLAAIHYESRRVRLPWFISNEQVQP